MYRLVKIHTVAFDAAVPHRLHRILVWGSGMVKMWHSLTLGMRAHTIRHVGVWVCGSISYVGLAGTR